jgi:hypothetical protein
LSFQTTSEFSQSFTIIYYAQKTLKHKGCLVKLLSIRLSHEISKDMFLNEKMELWNLLRNGNLKKSLTVIMKKG